MTTRAVGVPLAVRVAVAHAAVQRIAESAGIDVLHIKGPALDPSITWAGRHGTDADVLVRASEAPDLVARLRSNGWQLRSRFENSSAFEHSATLWHELWGYVDVHRYFPGLDIDPDTAFGVLWDRRIVRSIAEVDCTVPDVPGQILILLLHAARSGGSPRARDDVRSAWHEASLERREAVRALVDSLHAQVAFAAAVGDLDAYRDAPDHDLWAVVSRGGTRFEEWRARVKAAPTRRAAVVLALRAPLVNTDHLAMILGRPPRRTEVLAEFFRRPLRGLHEELRSRRRRGAR